MPGEEADELRRERDELRALVHQLTHSAGQDAARYRLLLENLNVGVFVTSLDGRMLECNERTVEMSGETREALFRKDLTTQYEDPQVRERLVAELRGKGSVRNFEIWTRHTNGERHASSMNAVLAPIGPQGSVVILGMLEDITERKLAEEHAAYEEERFRVIAEQSMLGLLLFQDDGIRFVNQAVADVNGYTIEEMLTWTPLDFARVIHPEDLALVIEQGQKKQAGDPSAQLGYCYRIFTKSGEMRWVEQYSRSIEFRGRTADFVTVIDITARKLAEESLDRLSATMEKTAKLEALGVLAAGIAHDFNNLLGGLFGHLDLARARADDAVAVRGHLDLARDAYERAKALTGQLLAFAKGGAPVRSVGSIATRIRRCTDFALSGSNVKVEFDLQDDLDNAEYDDNQLAQAFDNVLINAKQAMPGGGTLRIVARNVFVTDELPMSLQTGPYVKISFADGGSGISPEVMARVFDPFFTTKTEGSGVGLTAAYAIIKKHEGHIDVESKPGEGTTFHVWLPAVRTPVDRQPGVHEVARKGRGLVLVMDDDDNVRQAFASMLEHLGYNTVLTCHGVEALECARSIHGRGEHLSAALLDLTVRSGEGGREVVSRLRELNPDLPVIASSGYSDDPVMADPIKFGFSASLPKPFRMNELSELLGRLVRSQTG